MEDTVNFSKFGVNFVIWEIRKVLKFEIFQEFKKTEKFIREVNYEKSGKIRKSIKKTPILRMNPEYSVKSEEFLIFIKIRNIFKKYEKSIILK